VDLAAAAFHLVLRAERQLDGSLLGLVHARIVAGRADTSQDLTNPCFSGNAQALGIAWIGLPSMIRKALFILLGLAPLTIALHYLADLGSVTEFVLAAVALVPLAWLIGEATEHAAEHTGPGIGGFLNATFGNAPELIIALLAVNEGLTEVVRGSLTGSVIGNLLLVLGVSLVAGGRGHIDRRSSFMSFALIGLAVALFLVPSVPSWDGDPDRRLVVDLSLWVSIVLLVVYVAVTWYSLRRHRMMHVSSDEEVEAWSLTRSLVVLGAATVLTAFVAEVLVGTLEDFADQLGLTDFFVAAVIVAIVGNAAEHGGAVVVAHRGKITLAAEIALSSAAQVAVFLVPAVVLLSWLIEPLALGFRVVEIAALAFALVFTALALWNGRSSRLRGALLVAAYVGVAATFFVAGERG
jgi:Ca2+:H+ antiporter